MNIIDTMISNVDHHNDCREPQYSASMFYDRSGDGIITFGCAICCSYTNYQSSKAEIFDILDGTSLKNVSFARTELLTKDQLERRKVNVRPIFERNGTMSNLSFEIRYRHDDSVDYFDVIFRNGSDEAAQRRFFEYAVSKKGIDFPPAWEVINLASNTVRHVDDVYLKSVTVEKTNWIKSEGNY